MADVYVRKGAVVEAEVFDPARDDQGVSVVRDDQGAYQSATVKVCGRDTSIHLGDWIITGGFGRIAMNDRAFQGMYTLLDAVVTASVQEAAPAAPPAAAGEGGS